MPHVSVRAAVPGFGAAVLLAALLQGQPTQALEVGPQAGPLVISGEVPTGSSITSISSFLEPTQAVEATAHNGDTLALFPVPQDHITTDGDSYSISMDPFDIPDGFISPDGLVTFQVQAGSDQKVWLTGMTVRAVRDDPGSKPVWVSAGKSAFAVSEAASRQDGKPARGQSFVYPTAWDRVPVLGSAAGLVARRDVNEPESDSGEWTDKWASIDALDASLHPNCRKEQVGSDQQREATIGTAYPIGDSTAGMTVTRSEGSTYSGAVSASGVAKDVTTAVKAEGEYFTSGGWGKTWPQGGARRSFRAIEVYKKWYYTCLDPSESYARWRPYLESGGSGSNTGIDLPNFTYCTPTDAGPWYMEESTRKAYSLSTSVKYKSAIGLDLGIKRQYSGNQKIEYNIVQGKAGQNNRHRLCGNTTYPSQAGKVQEKWPA